eukprot:TRINITY_DN4096_c0_g1_i1.p1 TRINITY_DN4096_c0_g1~~TRINITY_DN4096_c0_g1_i1.p1  ORF type:complete len:598 (+),score=128.08 TRINITY_DN4096_c0_g1_i1:41-1795(+)
MDAPGSPPAATAESLICCRRGSGPCDARVRPQNPNQLGLEVQQEYSNVLVCVRAAIEQLAQDAARLWAARTESLSRRDASASSAELWARYDSKLSAAIVTRCETPRAVVLPESSASPLSQGQPSAGPPTPPPDLVGGFSSLATPDGDCPLRICTGSRERSRTVLGRVHPQELPPQLQLLVDEARRGSPAPDRRSSSDSGGGSSPRQQTRQGTPSTCGSAEVPRVEPCCSPQRMGSPQQHTGVALGKRSPAACSPLPTRRPPLVGLSRIAATFAGLSPRPAESNGNWGCDWVRVRSHACEMLHHLRTLFDYSPDVFEAAFGNGVWRETASPGKGGSRFLFVGNLVVKTMTLAESEFLRRLLPDYREHVQEFGHTRLPCFLGWYTVTYTRDGVSQTDRLLLMNNVYATPFPVLSVYDIKGSTHGRDAVRVVARDGGTCVRVNKDNDALREDLKVHLGFPRRDMLLAQFDRDFSFLERHRITDYSVLLGVRWRVRPRLHVDSQEVCVPEALSDGGLASRGIPIAGAEATVRQDVYYVGIIDILQQYTPRKWLESKLKGMVTDESTISVLPPTDFKQRLLRTLANIVV